MLIMAIEVPSDNFAATLSAHSLILVSRESSAAEVLAVLELEDSAEVLAVIGFEDFAESSTVLASEDSGDVFPEGADEHPQNNIAIEQKKMKCFILRPPDI
jgi:hypothetical protein